MRLLILLILAGAALAQEPPKPDPLAMTEAEKKDLTIANQALAILRYQWNEQMEARAALVARIEKAKGEGVKCDPERLTCAKVEAKKEEKAKP